MANRRLIEKSGRWAEIVAIIFLSLKFYQLLEWRKKTPLGEIDLILRHGKTLIFAEVKYRQTLEKAQISISPKQISRITSAAENYAMKRKWTRNLNWRYDVILLAPFCWPLHIKDAFRPID